MKQKQLKLMFIFLLGLGFTGIQAQTTLTTAGGNASGSGGSVSYTIGHTFYMTNTGSNGSVAEGVQQPYEISVISGIEESNEIGLSVSAYPNPTNDLLQLKVENENLKNLSFQLNDLQGKLLQSEKIIGNKTSIDMSHLVPATYFLKITSNNEEVSIFKIIKN